MAAPSQPGTPGFFSDGNLVGGQAPTVVPAEFLNTLMMEMLNVLSAGGIAPAKGVSNQLQAAIKSIIARSAYYRDTSSTPNLYAVQSAAPGVELVTNGNFTNDLSGWSVQVGGGTSVINWTSAGANILPDGSHQANLIQQITTTPGRIYLLTFTVSGAPVIPVVGSTSGGGQIFNPNTVAYSAGTYSIPFTATGTAAWITFLRQAAVNTTVSAVSCKDIGELVANGTFNIDTSYWATSSAFASTAAAVSGEMQVTATALNGRQVQAITCVPGRTYALSGTLRSISGAQANLFISPYSDGRHAGALARLTNPSTTAATMTQTFVASAATMYVVAGDDTDYSSSPIPTSSPVLGFSNIGVKAVPQVPISLKFRAASANTGPCMINIGQGVWPLLTEQGNQLVAGDIAAGAVTPVTYDPVLGYAIVNETLPSQTAPFRYVNASQLIGMGAFGTDTSAGAFTLTLPASPATGTAVRLLDLQGSWGINALTVAGNGNTIQGDTNPLVCNVSGEYIDLWFNGSDWRLV